MRGVSHALTRYRRGTDTSSCSALACAGVCVGVPACIGLVVCAGSVVCAGVAVVAWATVCVGVDACAGGADRASCFCADTSS